MTSMYEPGGDPAVAAFLVAAHQGCEACAAGQCETGAYAARNLAAYRADREQSRARIPHQRTGEQ
ncbi:hypothetical protein CSH63_24695 [Micromonospora tulbaghiae]|uniref:Uncharacterized protein n=1 Tax=Micromonospora tulbaghiae TaxID=479978 RepID=A0A386WRB2_9ACTN|nr:hypothetical protein [Micromonospora tulbaghiae]AYF30583.1 hypothetical protein CSH63_24695 [Micromonospora tulbaghiae]